MDGQNLLETRIPSFAISTASGIGPGNQVYYNIEHAEEVITHQGRALADMLAAQD